MIQGYDVVKSLTNLNDKVLKGCKGTVLIIYPCIPNSYEIEFVNDNYEPVDVLTVSGDDVINL